MTQSKNSDSDTVTAETSLTELAEDARNGNRSAFNQIVNRLQNDVFRMVYYRVRDRQVTEDLTQDIFMRAFQSINSIREPDRFRGWLFRIALNRVRDYQRRQKFRSLFKSADENPGFEIIDERHREQPQALDLVIKTDFWHQVGLILDKLSRMEREVFLLRFFDHLDIKEIATILKKTESTVKTHLYRALAKFRKQDSLRKFLQETPW